MSKQKEPFPFLDLSRDSKLSVLKHLPWRDLIKQLKINKTTPYDNLIKLAFFKQASIKLYKELCVIKAPEFWIKETIKRLIRKAMADAFAQAPKSLSRRDKTSVENFLKQDQNFTKLISQLINIASKNSNKVIYDFLTSGAFNIENVLSVHVEKGYIPWLIRHKQPAIAVEQAAIFLNSIADDKLRNKLRIKALDACIANKAYGYIGAVLKDDNNFSQADMGQINAWFTTHFDALREVLMKGLNAKVGYLDRLNDYDLSVLLQIVLQGTPADQVENFVNEVTVLAIKNHYLIVFKDFFESPYYSTTIKPIAEKRCGSYLARACIYTQNADRMDLPEYLLPLYKPTSDNQLAFYVRALRTIASNADHDKGLQFFTKLCTICTDFFKDFDLITILNDSESANDAFYYGNKTICQWLIQNNHIDFFKLRSSVLQNQLTVVHMFVAHGWIDMIKTHWDALKGSLEYKDDDGKTPLVLAARFLYQAKSNGDAIIKFLLQNGANPKTISNNGRTILHDLVQEERHNVFFKYPEVCRPHLLIPQVKRLQQFVLLLEDMINHKNARDKTALDLAFDELLSGSYNLHSSSYVIEQFQQAIELLIDHGAVCSDYKQFECALKYKWSGICEKMLANEENLKVFGKTPDELFEIAMANNLTSVAYSILKAHPELAKTMSIENLIKDHQKDNSQLIDALLSHGAQINKDDYELKYTKKNDRQLISSIINKPAYLKVLFNHNVYTISDLLKSSIVSIDLHFKVVIQYPKQFDITKLIVEQNLLTALADMLYYKSDRKQSLTTMLTNIVANSDIESLPQQSKLAILKKLTALKSHSKQAVDLFLSLALPKIGKIQFDDWATYNSITKGLRHNKGVSNFLQSCVKPTTYSYNKDTVEHLNTLRGQDALTDIIANNEFQDIDSFIDDQKLHRDIREMFTVKRAWNAIITRINEWKQETGKNKPFRNSYNTMWQQGNEVASVQKMMHNYFVWWTYFIHPRRHHRDLARKLFTACKNNSNMSSGELLKSLYQYHKELLARANVNKRGSMIRRLTKCIHEVEQKVDDAEVQLIRPVH